MSRDHLTSDELKQMAYEHISYEIEMFEYAGGRLLQGGLSRGEINVMLENFLLHARCLFDFLYPSQNPSESDVVADDYFEDPSILRSALPQRLQIADYLKSRTGKEVVHITYDRLKVTPSQKIWQVDEVHNQIGEALVTFFQKLPEEKRSWFRRIMQ